MKSRPAIRIAFVILAIVFAVVAIALPTAWYDALPRNTDYPPRPFAGTILLRLAFFFEAVVLAVLAATGWKPPALPGTAVQSSRPRAPDSDDLSRNAATAILLCIFAIAVALRALRLGADLWLDEITTVAAYAARPVAEVYAAYLSPGSHLLNSLLLKISVAAFGESEWSVRLPAAAFGVATIPAMYLAARLAMSRAASIGAALLLAVSYHHIFFSQNARGYSAHLFFTLVSSALLASALRNDRAWKWLIYVMSMALGFAALMTTVFTYFAHVVVGGLALGVQRRSGAAVWPLAARLLCAFAAAAFLAFQIYAVSIPDVIAIYPTVYAIQGSGYVVFSREFLSELARGLSAGFMSMAAAIAFATVAAGGFLILTRRIWALAGSLVLSIVFVVVFLLVRGQSIAPRFLLPGLLLAILSAMMSVEAATLILARRGFFSRSRARMIALGSAAVLSAISLIALPGYYSAPKQPYRSAIRHVERQRSAGADVMVVFPAVGGIRYYLPREGVTDTAGYHFVTTPSDYRVAMDSIGTGSATLVTTLFRVLHSMTPPLAESIRTDWVEQTRFRGTLGGGDMTVWRRRDPATAR